MEVIKKLGNNAAICKDKSGRELIALGLGIGFPKCPYTLTDLSKVDRTFYNVDNEYLHLFETVDSDILNISADVIMFANDSRKYYVVGGCDLSNGTAVVLSVADGFVCKIEVQNGQ